MNFDRAKPKNESSTTFDPCTRSTAECDNRINPTEDNRPTTILLSTPTAVDANKIEVELEVGASQWHSTPRVTQILAVQLQLRFSPRNFQIRDMQQHLLPFIAVIEAMDFTTFHAQHSLATSTGRLRLPVPPGKKTMQTGHLADMNGQHFRTFPTGKQAIVINQMSWEYLCVILFPYVACEPGSAETFRGYNGSKHSQKRPFTIRR